MALVSSIVGTLSGKLAGTVYSHNRGGPYIRRLAIPTNPSTSRQTAIRNAMSANSRAWNGLTSAQRLAWVLYASTNAVINRLGNQIHLSGIAMRNKLAQVAYDSGSTPTDSPPAGVGPASLTSVGSITNSGSTLSIPFSPSPLGAAARIAVRTTGPGRTSQDPNYRLAKLAGYSGLNPSTPLSIVLPYSVVANQVTNIFLSVVDSSGRETPLFKKRYTFT